MVNYDPPIVAEDYIHRIGRTGRAGATGEAISLVCADEAPLLGAIETLLKTSLSRDEEPGFEPTHRVPATGPAAAAPKPKKPKVAGGQRSGKGAPGNWVGFDDFPDKPARLPGPRPTGGGPRNRSSKPRVK